MTRDLEYNITAQDNGVTISDYLKKQGFSHAVTVQLKKIPESILLNGKWEYMGTSLNGGDCLSIHFEETDGSKNIVAADLPLSICYEDEDILVVNKPADMPIHPSMNNYDNTLANAVCHYYQTQGIPYTFRCVNRLDRDTTGLTILAKHLISSAILNSEVSVQGISRDRVDHPVYCDVWLGLRSTALSVCISCAELYGEYCRRAEKSAECCRSMCTPSGFVCLRPEF